MKDFELRKIKSFEPLSEETEAFTAQLWVDGKHVADLKNDGQGGCNNFSPIKPFTWKDIEPYQATDVECKIFAMIIEFDETRKRQSKGFYLRKGEMVGFTDERKYYSQKFPMPISKLRKHPDYKNWLSGKLADFKAQGYTVLNTNL